MPLININFIGPLRLFVGMRSVSVNVYSLEEARVYVERNFGPVFERKLKSMGARKKMSIWDTSNVLLNGKGLKPEDIIALKDKDRIDLISRVTGG
jgi:hypothetical protein